MFEEAPGSHIDGGWAGDIRAIKWRDQEGRVHNGCKGTVQKRMYNNNHLIDYLLYQAYLLSSLNGL